LQTIGALLFFTPESWIYILPKYKKVGRTPFFPTLCRSVSGAREVNNSSDLLVESLAEPALSRAVKRAVWMRDGAACSIRSKNGRRCRSSYGLEIDHVIPFASYSIYQPFISHLSAIYQPLISHVIAWGTITQVPNRLVKFSLINK
jgi:hypothetical protein